MPRSADAVRALPPINPIRFIDESGQATNWSADNDMACADHPVRMPDHETLVRLYGRMVIARRFEAQVSALTRQGRLATYPSAAGQEACEIGAVSALRATDWLFPTYRDSAALLTRGIPVAEILGNFRGDWHCNYDSQAHNTAPAATPLATQGLHATGYAMAAKLRGEDTVALTFMGDGATSEGDAHEAFNFAATWKTPTIFFIQNNQYAISVPLREQTNATRLADKAVGYGMPGFCVDGNDAAAVYAVMTAAVERARAGQGPTLIEGLTYRMEAHTNSDDPTRYRDGEEVELWKQRDPIARLETYLRAAGVLDDVVVSAFAAEAEEVAATAREAMSVQPELNPLEIFDHVYAHPRPALAEQRALLEAELSEVS